MKLNLTLTLSLVALSLAGNLAWSQERFYYKLLKTAPDSANVPCTPENCLRPLETDTPQELMECGSSKTQCRSEEKNGYMRVEIAPIDGSTHQFGWMKRDEWEQAMERASERAMALRPPPATETIDHEPMEPPPEPEAQPQSLSKPNPPPPVDCHCQPHREAVSQAKQDAPKISSKVEPVQYFDMQSCPLEIGHKSGRHDAIVLGRPVAEINGQAAVQFSVVTAKDGMDVKSFKKNDGSMPARTLNEYGDRVCQVKVLGCSNTPFAQRQLTHYKGFDRELTTRGCKAATDAYYSFCDPESKMAPEDRREDIGRKIERNFPYFKALPSTSWEKPAFDTKLAKCLVARENPSYQPYRINKSACIDHSSSAVGLFQVTVSNIEHLLEDNHCADFKRIEETALIEKNIRGLNTLEKGRIASLCVATKDYYGKGKRGEAWKTAEKIQVDMSTDANFQILLGLVALNHMLADNGNNIAQGLEHWKTGVDAKLFSGAVQGCVQCLAEGRSSGSCLDSARNH